MPDDSVTIDVRLRFRIPRAWLEPRDRRKLYGHLAELLRDHGHRKESLTPFYNATSTGTDSLVIEVVGIFANATGKPVNLGA